MKRFFSLFLVLMIILSLGLIGCKEKTTTETTIETSAETTSDQTTAESLPETTVSEKKVRTVEEREDALPGESITPKDFNRDFLPGIENVGAVPLKKYKIAFSNGDFSNEWRRNFYEDMLNYAKMYTDTFGIEFISANSGNNSVKQLQDIQSLLAQKPDILIMSPNESGPLTAVVDFCKEAGIPLMTIDRAIDASPGDDVYISAILIDGYRSGVAQGINLVKRLTEKYGTPKGNVAEIPGILGATPSKFASMGVRRVLADYPEIKIVTVRPGEYDAQISFKAAQDILTVNKKGTLDAIIDSSTDATQAVIEAIKSAGRDELLGYIFGIDGTVADVEAILRGDVYHVSEEPPFFGMITFEYAIHYLNGESIPPIVPMPQRVLTAETPEKKAKLESMLKATKEKGLLFIPSSEGGYDLFVMDKEMQMKYYPKPYWEQPAEYLTEFEPYTEMK